MKAGKIEIRGDREISNGNFARFPILHRFENVEVEGCKECNRQERKFTNEDQRGSGLEEELVKKCHLTFSVYKHGTRKKLEGRILQRLSYLSPL